MRFPKNYMTINELSALGLSEVVLREWYQTIGYPLAFKETGTRTCPIKFDTILLEKHIKNLNERGCRK